MSYMGRKDGKIHLSRRGYKKSLRRRMLPDYASLRVGRLRLALHKLDQGKSSLGKHAKNADGPPWCSQHNEATNGAELNQI